MNHEQKGSGRRALVLRFAQQYTVAAIGLLSTMVLARLLTPAEVGIYAIVSVIAGILHNFRDFGISDYVVREPVLNADRIATVRALMFCSSWAVAVVLALLAEPLAGLYREPEVFWITVVLAASFVVIPFGSMTQGYLRRELRLDAIFVMSTASTVVGTLVSVGCAWAGYGAISLAYGSLCRVLVTTVLARHYRPPELRVRPAFRATRQVVRFSSFNMMNAILGVWVNGAPALVLGRVLTADAVGLLSKAMGVVDIFSANVASPIISILFPVLSRELRDKPDQRHLLVRFLALLSAIGFAFFAVLAVLVADVILVLFGDQWVPAAPAARVFCVYGAALTLATSFLVVLTAFGWVARNSAVTGLMAISVPVGVFLAATAGLPMVAAVLSALMIGTMLLRGWLFHRCTGFTIRDWSQALSKSVILAAAAGLAALLVDAVAAQLAWPPLMTLAVAVPVCGGAWLLSARLVGHECWRESQVMMAALRARFRSTPAV
jgi:O-antigen/teichoic acid export membrane protein